MSEVRGLPEEAAWPVTLPATSTDTTHAPVAQGTERRTSNPRAGGSNPPRRATCRETLAAA